jgi:hypothetical protein
MDEHLMEELYELCEVRESGTAFILRHSHVKMKLGSSLLKKLAKKPWGHGPGWPTVRSVSWLPVDGRELTQLDMRSAGICIVLQLKKNYTLNIIALTFKQIQNLRRLQCQFSSEDTQCPFKVQIQNKLLFFEPSPPHSPLFFPAALGRKASNKFSPSRLPRTRRRRRCVRGAIVLPRSCTRGRRRALLLLLEVAPHGPEHLGAAPHGRPRRVIRGRALGRQRHHHLHRRHRRAAPHQSGVHRHHRVSFPALPQRLRKQGNFVEHLWRSTLQCHKKTLVN